MLKMDSETDVARLIAQAIERQNERAFPEATALFNKALKINAKNLVAHYSLGYIYAQENKFALALKHLNKVVAQRPDFAAGHQARSIIKHQLGDSAGASKDMATYLLLSAGSAPLDDKISAVPAQAGSAAQVAPSPPIASRSLLEIMEGAQTLQQQGNLQAALDLYIDYLKHCEAGVRYIVKYNASVLMMELKQPQDVQVYLKEAIADNPEFFQGYLGLGTFLENLGHPNEAIEVWKTALGNPALTQPQHLAIHCSLLTNIGRVYEIQRDYDSAEAALHESLELDLSQGPVMHHWLHLRQKQCKWPSSYGLKLTHEEVTKHASALTMLSISDDPADQLKAAQRFIEEKVGKFPRMVGANKRYGHDKVRIGYLSSDLSMHAVSLLTVELFETHDRDRFEIHAFCWSKEDGTAFRQRVLKGFDHFHAIGALDDESAAKLIVENEIDVLVDLQGLTAGARPNILARGPAPMQISWLGFPGPCAIPYVDYIVADTFIFPETLKKHFTEKPLYLETLYQTSDSQREVGPTPTRAALGIPEDKFVFCAFNNNYKITPEMFESWMRILRGAPNSVIWLLEDNKWSRENLTRAACAHGVRPDRLFFAGRVLPKDYLARFKAADLFLDTTPYNAGTTANDALWVGLPLLTLSGQTYVSRMAGSLLRSAGLEELITFNRDDYEAKAIELAGNPRKVKEYRDGLIKLRESGSLFSTKRFCGKFEGAVLSLIAKQ